MKKFDNNLEVNPFNFKNVPKRAKTFSGLKKNSYYLTMRDGVKIAVEVLSPKDLSSKDKLPAILLQTRYWRDYDFRIPFKWFIKDYTFGYNKYLHKIGIKRGFVFVKVDVRGTGASFGTRPWPWSTTA